MPSVPSFMTLTQSDSATRARRTSRGGPARPGVVAVALSWLICWSSACLLDEWDGPYDPRADDDDLDDSWGDDPRDDLGTPGGLTPSVDPADDPTVESGVLQSATILRRGVEFVLVGGDYGTGVVPGTRLRTQNHDLIDFSISANGRFVWALLLDEAGSDATEQQLQLWSLPTDGTDALQSRFTAPKGAALLRSARVHTDESGSSAILLVPWQVADSQGEFADDRDYAIYLATRRGRAMDLIVDTSEIADFGPVAIDYALYSDFAADGASWLLNDGHRIWQATRAENWQPAVAFDLDPWLALAGKDVGLARLHGLAGDATGTHWISALYEPGADWAHALVRGDGSGLVTVESSQRRTILPGFDLDASGNSFVFTLRGDEQNQRAAQLGHESISPRALTTDIDTSLEASISGDGRSMYIVNGVQDESKLHTGYFDSTAITAQRVRAHTDALVGPAARNVQLSHDARVMAAPITIARSGKLERKGLWVCLRDPDMAMGVAEIVGIRHRYDSKNNLFVEVDLRSDSPLGPVYMMPMQYDYIDPAALAPDNQNPLAGMRAAHMVPRSMVTQGLLGYEARIALGPRELAIDGSYSARLVVTSGESDSPLNQAVFVDFALPPRSRASVATQTEMGIQ